jgi:hypothetical protein
MGRDSVAPCPQCGCRGHYENGSGDCYCEEPGCPYAARVRAYDREMEAKLLLGADLLRLDDEIKSDLVVFGNCYLARGEDGVLRRIDPSRVKLSLKPYPGEEFCRDDAVTCAGVDMMPVEDPK